MCSGFWFDKLTTSILPGSVTIVNLMRVQHRQVTYCNTRLYMPTCPLLWGCLTPDWQRSVSLAALFSALFWVLWQHLARLLGSNQGEIKLVSVSLELKSKREEMRTVFCQGCVCFRSVCVHNPHYTHVTTNTTACGMHSCQFSLRPLDKF